MSNSKQIQSLVMVLLTLCVIFMASSAGAAITPLSGPGDFTSPTTTVNFDGFAHGTIANTLYTAQGVEFSRDDGLAVPIFDWAALGRTTSSSPNVIATISGTFEGQSVPTFVFHLNLEFSSPMLELGAFFGNDQGSTAFSPMRLAVFDENDISLGSVAVTPNGNTSVDQFVGLRSDVRFYSARFENENTTNFSVILDDVTFGPIPEPTTLALIDIKPGSDPNSVNLKSKGVLPIAVLGSNILDTSDIDITTLLFGDPLLIDNGGTAVSPLRSAYEDVSGDGLLDLTLKFSMAEMVEFEALGLDTIEGLLTGALLDGTPFAGTDSIRIVPPNGSNGNSLQTSAVPEPSTLALASLFAFVGIIARRRRS